MNIFNSDYCHSVKNKNNTNLQCQNKHKPNEIFCGVHLNSTNIIMYKYENNNNIIEKNDNISIQKNNIDQQKNDFDEKIIEKLDLDINKIISENIIINNSPIKNDDKIIYSKDELFEIISNNSYISVYSIRKSIKNCGLRSMVDTKQSKQILIKLLKNLITKERYYISNICSIILMQ